MKREKKVWAAGEIKSLKNLSDFINFHVSEDLLSAKRTIMKIEIIKGIYVPEFISVLTIETLT